MFQNAELTVREYLDMMRRRRWLIAAVTIVVGTLGTVPAVLSSPVYASMSQVQVSSEIAASAFDTADEMETTRTRELATATEVITNREMRSRVVERLGPDGAPFNQVSAELNGFTEIIDVTVTAPSAAGAADAANVYAEIFVEQRQRSVTGALTAQETQLRSQAQELNLRREQIDALLADPELALLELENLRQERAQLAVQMADYERRADELKVDVSLRQEATSIASRAPLVQTPIAPKPFRSGLIALIVGFLVGVCFAVFLEVVRDRIADSTGLENLDPDLMLLSSVPHVDLDLDDPGHRLPAQATEAFRYLRASIQFRALVRPVRSILVTSAMSGEGKTTTAINLALTMAESGSRVVLIDADMRKAAVHGRLGVSNGRGLSDVLARDANFGDVVRFERPNLALITAGQSSVAATDLLGGDEFIGLVRAVQDQCDLVIVDAPPVLPVADALLAARATDTTMVVSRLGRVRRRDVKATIRRLREARIDVLGLVANDTDRSSSYEYGRDSSYFEQRSAQAPADATGQRDE